MVNYYFNYALKYFSVQFINWGLQIKNAMSFPWKDRQQNKNGLPRHDETSDDIYEGSQETAVLTLAQKLWHPRQTKLY